MTLTEFLLARIAEDEAEARTLSHYGSTRHDGRTPMRVKCDPTRLLAEVKAKRQVVEWHTQESEQRARWGDGDTCCEDRYGPIVMLPADEQTLSAGTTFGGGLSITESFATQVRYGCVTLMMLSAPYSDHPDYNPSWRV